MGALKEGVQKQKLEVQQLVRHPGFPVDCHVKRTDKEVYLPPFIHIHNVMAIECVSVYILMEMEMERVLQNANAAKHVESCPCPSL